MKISASGEYAVRIVAQIAKSEDYVSLKDVTQREDISIKFAEKIAGKLVKENILTSLRGADGGYKLSKPASETSVGEILHAMGDLSKVSDCISSGCPHIENCSSVSVWQKLNGLINDYLNNVMISSLLEKDVKIK